MSEVTFLACGYDGLAGISLWHHRPGFDLRFPGLYPDKETGLFYNYFRDYDPQTGGTRGIANLSCCFRPALTRRSTGKTAEFPTFSLRSLSSGYDALYFDLARVLGLPLGTLDHGHRQAAKSHGVKLVAYP